MTILPTSAAWQALQHAASEDLPHLRELFQTDPERVERYSLSAAGILLDYSKNRIDDRILQQLFSLAEQAEVESWRNAIFAGEIVNHTEQRAVMHSGLRLPAGASVLVNKTNVAEDIAEQRRQMYAIAAAIRSGEWLGYSGHPIHHIVNIGIGGSDLGPKMVCEALAAKQHPDLVLHFVSNIDGAQIEQILPQCEPEKTLFIIASKSFNTQETLHNALAARSWFLAKGGSDADIPQHFIAITANAAAATSFGIPANRQLLLWDWVGGRYSLWSSIGLPIALSIGQHGFEELLQGAYAMDQHFQTAPLAANMPVILALLGVWYHNFLGLSSYAILPYAHGLVSLPDYLQQADMESNGKSTDRAGNAVDYLTGPIIWGGVGTNAQHAFFQLLHQGTTTVPADFILVREPTSHLTEQHKMLLANGVAQMEALMQGKTLEAVKLELDSEQQNLAPYKVFVGNKPSNAIVLDALTPANLGALIALYEHKIFVQGIIWNINSFDQWGVEYGKQLAKNTLQVLSGAKDVMPQFSSSTQSLLQYLLKTSG